MQMLTVVNRTSRNLSGKWDGRDYIAPPGKSAYPRTIAEAIKRANPIMGSDDPITGQLQYLIGIEESGDPTSPIEQSDVIELFSRPPQKDDTPIIVIPGNSGMYSVKRAEVAAALPKDSNFVKA